jgi:hypothetical protein
MYTTDSSVNNAMWLHAYRLITMMKVQPYCLEQREEYMAYSRQGMTVADLAEGVELPEPNEEWVRKQLRRGKQGSTCESAPKQTSAA